MVPRKLDFQRATHVYHERVHTAIEAGQLVCAFIFGSVAQGTHGPRSDFDSFMVPAEGAEWIVPRITRAMHEAGGGRVQIGNIEFTEQELRTGRHEMDKYFGAHLMSEYRVISGRDIANAIAYDPKTPQEILTDYIREKKRKLKEAKSNPDHASDKYLLGLQRMLELPYAIGRKLLMATDELYDLANAPGNSGDKSTLRSRALLAYRAFDISDLPNDLIVQDMHYSELLAQFASYTGSPKDSYQRALGRMRKTLPEAIQWLDRLDQIVNGSELERIQDIA